MQQNHIDVAVIEQTPQRLENMVASHLLKYAHYAQDTKGEDLNLYYFRDSDGREVDFILADRKNPIMAVEVKWADEDIHKPLLYFKRKFPGVDAWQVHATGRKEYTNSEGIRVAPAQKLFEKLV